ncbi:MAG: hypothetical protein EBY04_07690, partial [Actinobacteria bacterium]|nr:hypothetical protein [Actinomycetota bacterium]
MIPKDCRSVERPWQETIDANVAEVAEAVGETSAADRQLVGEDSGSVAKVTTFEASVVSAVLVATMIAVRVVRAVMLEVSVVSADRVAMTSVVNVVNAVHVVRVVRVVMISVASVASADLAATMIAVRV